MELSGMKHDWFFRRANVIPKGFHEPKFFFNRQITKFLKIDAHGISLNSVATRKTVLRSRA